MNEPLSEKQLQSWTPRRPSTEIHTRLFPRANAARRQAEFFGWLTPVAACAFAVMVAIGGAHRQYSIYDAPDNTAYSTTISLNASNPAQKFVFSRTDVNLQWNVWPSAQSEKVTNLTTPSSSLESWNAAATNHI